MANTSAYGVAQPRAYTRFCAIMAYVGQPSHQRLACTPLPNPYWLLMDDSESRVWSPSACSCSAALLLSCSCLLTYHQTCCCSPAELFVRLRAIAPIASSSSHPAWHVTPLTTPIQGSSSPRGQAACSTSSCCCRCCLHVKAEVIVVTVTTCVPVTCRHRHRYRHRHNRVQHRIEQKQYTSVTLVAATAPQTAAEHALDSTGRHSIPGIPQHGAETQTC
jgi:hypothetical protein